MFLLWNDNDGEDDYYISYHSKHCLFKSNSQKAPLQKNAVIDIFDEEKADSIQTDKQGSKHHLLTDASTPAIHFVYLSRLQSSILSDMFLSEESSQLFSEASSSASPIRSSVGLDISGIQNMKYQAIDFSFGPLIIFYNTMLPPIILSVISAVKEANKLETVSSWLEQIWSPEEKIQTKTKITSTHTIVHAKLNSLSVLLQMPDNPNGLLLSLDDVKFKMLMKSSDYSYNSNKIYVSDLVLYNLPVKLLNKANISNSIIINYLLCY